jgi:hypothetical protein
LPISRQISPNVAIWSYSNRTLTGLTGQPRTDIWGEDANYETGTGTRKVLHSSIGTGKIEHTLDVSTTSNTYVKLKSIQLGGKPAGGYIGTYFEIYAYSTSYTMYGKIYKNGVAIGTERSTTSATPVGFFESFSGINSGDTIELWGRHSTVAYAGHALNFKVYLGVLLS